jgi:hypothetical protein
MKKKSFNMQFAFILDAFGQKMNKQRNRFLNFGLNTTTLTSIRKHCVASQPAQTEKKFVGKIRENKIGCLVD